MLESNPNRPFCAWLSSALPHQSTARGWDSTRSSSPAGCSPSFAPDWERRGENWTRWFKLSCPSNPGRIGYICLRGCHRAGLASKGPPRHRGHDSICALLGLGTGEPRHLPARGAWHFPGGVCMSRSGSTAANTGKKSPVARKRSPPSAKTTATPPWARARVLQPPPRSGCCSPGESPNGTLARGKTRLKPT